MAIQSGDPAVDKLLARRKNTTRVASTTTSALDGPGSVGGSAARNQLAPSALDGPGSVGGSAARNALAAGLTGAGAVTAPTAPAPTPSATPPAVTTPPAATTGEGTAVVEGGTDVGEDAFAGFTEDDIAAALSQIEAEFGLTKEQLLADQTMLGAQYRLLTAQLARTRQRSLEGAEAGALQRGLFRSGIFAEEVGQIGEQFSEQKAQLAASQGAQEGTLASELATLDARKELEKATAASDIRFQEYEARLAAAGI